MAVYLTSEPDNSLGFSGPFTQFLYVGSTALEQGRLAIADTVPLSGVWTLDGLRGPLSEVGLQTLGVGPGYLVGTGGLFAVAWVKK